jgi:hypothetical protein
MIRVLRSLTLSIFALGILSSSAYGQLNINFDFSNFYNTAPATVSALLNNDSWNAGTSDMDRLDAAVAVMEEAADCIENLFVNCTDVQVSQTIDVGWAPLGGPTLATGGTGWNGSNQLAGGTLTWDSDGSSSFFADLTPADSVEYTASPNDTRTMNFNGTDNNVEDRHYANFSGTAAGDHSDMLTTAKHEIMHALGVLGTYPLYAQLDPDNDGDLDLVADGNTYEVAYSGGHTTISLPWDGPGSLGNGIYYPNLIGPGTIRGTRGGITDIDTLLLANIHGFGAGDFPVSINPSVPFHSVPFPSHRA